MYDEIARYNKERWEELAQAGVAYSRPFLDLTEESARALIDPHGVLGEVRGKDVLCLAGGGGQQSMAFALLGAQVTVLDLAETQLARDQEAARHYGFTIATHQGDMRDLSRFADRSFDVVWHAHSINFVPDTAPVFDGVRRVLRAGGFYHLSFHNPFTQSIDDRSWNGRGYLITEPYFDGQMELERLFEEVDWEIEGTDGVVRLVKGPYEFRHTLGTLVNGLAERGLYILRLTEDKPAAVDPLPGSWDHYMLVTMQYLKLTAKLMGN